MSKASQKWYYEHHEEMKAKNREYQRIYRERHKLTKEQKEEKKKLQKNFKEMFKYETIKEIDENTFENYANKNKAILYHNADGKWWYKIEYNSKREPYISSFFDKRILAIKDLKVAI